MSEPLPPKPPAEAPIDFGPDVHPPQQSGSSTLTILLIVFGIVGVVGVLVIGLLVALLLPAMQSVQKAAQRSDSQNRIRQLAIGIHNYHDTHRRLPASKASDENGKALHSWRVAILPFIEQSSVWNQMDKELAWNEGVNKSLSQLALDNFSSPRCPDSSGTHFTAYAAIVGEDTVIRENASSLEYVQDGTANTIMLIELPQSDIAWTEPRDVSVEEAIQIIKNSEQSGGTVVAMADGSVRTIRKDTSDKNLRALMGCSDGEMIFHDD